MATTSKKEINNEVMDLKAIHTVLEAYEEIAAIRMRRIKSYVLHNREFLNGLNTIFARIRGSYRKEIKTLMLKEGNTKIKKEVVVLLSANTGLFGSITEETFNLFYKYIESSSCDLIIIGKMGKAMSEAVLNGREFLYFALEEGLQELPKMQPLVERLVQYENVTVFHGEFQDILHQVPVKTALTGEGTNIEFLGQEDEVKSIFEPELKKILSFFQSQILAALFEQTLYESSLSKYTSRMISLDKASSDVSVQLNKSQLALKRFDHTNYNRKQNGVLSSLPLWLGRGSYGK